MAKSSKNPKDKLTKTEKQALKTILKTRHGLSIPILNTLIDDNDSTLDAQKIEQNLTAYLAGLPKG